MTTASIETEAPGPDPKTLSIVRGMPLIEEPGLGALTLPGFFAEVTARYAAREALVLHADEGVVRWSYAQLWESAVAIARALIASGTGKDSRVGVLMTNRPEWIASFFGVGLAGGVPVALSTFSTAPELEYLLQTSCVSTLLFERRVANKNFAFMLDGLDAAIGAAEPGKLFSAKFPFLRRIAVMDEQGTSGCVESWSEFLKTGAAIPRSLLKETASAAKPSDAGALFLSSGSTSRPKGILSSHRGVAIQCWRMRRIFALHDDVRAWSANAFTWSGNFSIALGATLAAGGSQVLQRLFDPAEALELMQTERVNWPSAWPHQWAQLRAAANWDSVDLSALRYVDPSRPAVQHPTFRASTWRDPMWSYGSTETFTLSTAYPSDTPLHIADGSNGEPLPGNVVKIVDALSGELVPRGAHGEICVKGPTLMLGYLGTPLSETLDDDGFFHSGDGGYIDERGRLHFEGRLSDIIKTGGANVSPVEVDSVLTTCPGVKAAMTVGIPHETLGEMVVSCVVPQVEGGLDLATVRDFLKQRLASYKLPRRILLIAADDLTLTGSAKIRAGAMRELAAKRLSAEAESKPAH
jgi:fatty-acyl-CoA synthase